MCAHPDWRAWWRLRLTRRVVQALLLCARGAWAMDPQGEAQGDDPACPPVFMRLDGGQRLEAHASSCAAWKDGRGASAPTPARSQSSTLRLMTQVHLQGGGMVLDDAGTQYFVKLRGIHGVRLGVKIAF